MTLIYLVIVQCPSVGTTRYCASCATECACVGFRTAPEGEWFCIDLQTTRLQAFS